MELGMDINEFAKAAHQNAVEHGFWPPERTDDEVIALIHSEWSEALECYRNDELPLWYSCAAVGPGIFCDPTDCNNWGQDDNGEEICLDHKAKPEGVAVELIDGVIRLLDAAVVWDALPISLEDGFNMKPIEVACWPLPTLVTKLHYMTAQFTNMTPFWRKDHIGDMIQGIFTWLGGQDIDPESVLKQKHEYNLHRPYKHGKLI